MLKIDRLSLSRGDRVLFSGLSLSLSAGELLHVRGANGCGKTSLLEALAGLRRVASGVIRTQPDPLPLHWIGHRNALSASLSPLQNLEFWAGLHGADAAAADAALAAVGLKPAVRKRAVRSLSAGQKRRCALARLLLQVRALWLLDEPLDGLDADGIALMADLLRAHLDGGGLVVMTSHQMLPAALPGVRELALDRLGSS
ncbi:heme ABC exporter ATP-binding protein CcmA [Sinimarinibacterium thermocellulolyticum]|uniref:heme ABC exporter ATP-binding protein CcmA n=1 Tax=Sinimarinibacterium thermocellulolyticum TaxID=3170016 RepID=UPI00333811BD